MDKSEKVEKVEKKITEADRIWNEIKGMSIDVYAIQNQVVEQHATMLPMPGDRLVLKLRSSAVLPALETAIGRKYEVELVEKYVIVKRAKTNL